MMTQKRTIPGFVMTLAFAFVLVMVSMLGPDVVVGSTAEQAPLQQAQDPPPPVPEDGEPVPPAPAVERSPRRQVFPALEEGGPDHPALKKLKDELEQSGPPQSPAQALAPPAHDDFDNAKTIGSLPYSDADDTVDATVAFDDPSFPCGSATTPTQSNTVWYEYTAPSGGQMSADTIGSDYDTVLAVWTGNRGSLTNVACNDDSSDLQSAVQFPITADVTYYIEVASYGAPDGGNLVLNVRVPTASLGWAERRDLPNDRNRLAVVSDGTYVYAIGGQEFAGVYQESTLNQRYNPANDWWTDRAPMPLAYSNMDAAYLDGKIYIPAGYNDGSYLGTHYVFNIASNSWSTETAAPWASTTITPVLYYGAAADPARNVYYLTGGSNGLGATDTLLRYNAGLGNWTVLPSMQTARFGHEATVIDGLLYVAGGVKADWYTTTSAEVYDPDLNSWSDISSMGTDRVFAGNASGVVLEQPTNEWGNGTSIPDTLYVDTGNYRMGSVSDDCERIWVFGGGVDQDEVLFYDSSSDTWTTGKTPVPNSGMSWQAVQIGGAIYLAGGWTVGEPGHHNDLLQIYNIAGDSWSAGANMPAATTPMAAAVDDKLYTFGGNPGPSSTVWAYEPISNTWETGLAPMPTARTYGRAIGIDSHIFVVGGGTSVGPTGAFERYDPAGDAWLVGPSMNTPRADMSLFVVGDYLYASGGIDDYGTWNGLTAVERYFLPDFPAGSWEAMPPAPDGFGAAAYGCANDKMWSISGLDGAGLISSANRYQDENLPCACSQTEVSIGDGKWYIAGGGFSSQGEVLRTVEAYDPGSDTWEFLDPSIYNLNEARRHLNGAATSSGSFYATGGDSFYPGPDGDILSEQHEVMIDIHQNLLPNVLKDYCSDPDPYEPNDQFSLAYVIQSNVTYHGYFACTNDDVDLFRLQLATTGTIQAWLTNIPVGSNFTLALYNSAKQLVTYSGQSGNADEYFQATGQPAGTYYLQIFNQGGTHGTNVSYNLRAAY